MLWYINHWQLYLITRHWYNVFLYNCSICSCSSHTDFGNISNPDSPQAHRLAISSMLSPLYLRFQGKEMCISWKWLCVLLGADPPYIISLQHQLFVLPVRCLEQQHVRTSQLPAQQLWLFYHLVRYVAHQSPSFVKHEFLRYTLDPPSLDEEPRVNFPKVS